MNYEEIIKTYIANKLTRYDDELKDNQTDLLFLYSQF